MYALDFEYDGLRLSDFGFIICDFDYSNGTQVLETGSRITFNKVDRNQSKNNSLVSTKYESCIQTTLDICKDPDIYDYNQREISDSEYRTLVRWLNRKEFLRFNLIPLDDNNNDGEICYFNSSFNIGKITISEKLYGLRLSMESDKPFGYGQERLLALEFSIDNNTKVVRDISDEIGYTYPSMNIMCITGGDLSIHNDFDDCTMEIKNCTAGERIIIDGDTQIISTSMATHDICNDFNYEFLKIGNTLNRRNNTISTTAPCIINMSYYPIIKNFI